MFVKEKKDNMESHEEKKYQFIREQVKPQKKKKVWSVSKKIGCIIGAAFLFGMISGAVIVCIQNYFLVRKETIVEVKKEFPTVSPKQQKSIGKIDKASIGKINNIYEKMAAVGNQENTSIVGIKSKGSSKNWFADDNDSGNRTAYGIIYQETQKKYYILTTCDIIKEQPMVNVRLINDYLVNGEILGSDVQLNIAVVCIKKADIPTSVQLQTTVAQFGENSDLKIGSSVIAVGCPNGILKSVVIGRVTKDDITASITDGEIKLYSTDMPIAKWANGVVLNTQAQIIGILSNDFLGETGESTLAFLDFSDVYNRIESLQYKKMIPYLGMEGKSIRSMVAKSHNLDNGSYVTSVYSDSPAYKSGLRVADVIVSFEDKKSCTMQEIYDCLMTHKKGDTIECRISRRVGKKKVYKNLKIKLE